jgi:RND family efflux transporter MFP subunit
MIRSLWPAGVLVAAALTTPSCSKSQAATPAETTDAPTVAVARVATGTVAQTLTIAAEFRPFQEIEVHAKVAGYVKTINVDVGDRVHAGQLLAELEIPELRDDLRENAAAVKRATEDVNRAAADLQRAESAHDVTHLASTRLASVSKARPNLVAQQDLDDASGRDRVAEAQVATAKAALASAQEQLEIAQAGQTKTQTLIDYTRINAPFDGVITRRYADQGAMIQAGTSSQTQAMPIVTLSQNSRLRLVIPVPESAVSRIHVGTPVTVNVQSLHRTVPGTVARIADRLDTDTRTMRVEVDVPNTNLQLVPGMYADASLVLDRVDSVLVAPTEAVDRSDTTSSVLIVAPDNSVRLQDVTLGLEAADRIEVKTGLHAGDLLVLGNRSQLKPGTRVIPKVTTTSASGAR